MTCQVMADGPPGGYRRRMEILNTATNDDTRAVVHQYLSALGAGEVEVVASLFAETFDWRLNWPADQLGGEIPWIRARATTHDVAQHFRTIAAHHQPAAQGTTVDQVLVDGEDAVVMGTIRQRMLCSGQAYEARFALHLRVTAGRIVRHHVYEDSLAVWLAWHGPRPA
jgi:uncharacterized protein